MNKYFLTEPQQKLQQETREFAQQELAPHVKEMDKNGIAFPVDLMRKAASGF